MRITTLALSCALLGSTLSSAAYAGAHSSHGKELEPPEMTQEQMDGVRDKIKKFANYSDEELLRMMAILRNESGYLSAAETTNDVGVLVLAHGFHGEGFTQFTNRFEPIINEYPTGYGFGLFIMESQPMQDVVDSLEKAGAKNILLLPATTAEHSTMVRQWKYILGDLDEPSFLDVPRVENDVNFIWAPNPMSHPIMTEIMGDQAATASKDPANEVVVILGHGPSLPEDNARELEILAGHAKTIQKDKGFHKVYAANVQDDAPAEMRAENVEKIRGWIKDAKADGKEVIVTTTVMTKAGVMEKLRNDVSDLGITFVDIGLMLHPRFIDWLNIAIDESLTPASE